MQLVDDVHAVHEVQHERLDLELHEGSRGEVVRRVLLEQLPERGHEPPNVALEREQCMCEMLVVVVVVVNSDVGQVRSCCWGSSVCGAQAADDVVAISVLSSFGRH